MDMNTAYNLEVRMHCPQAEVVYDLFYVVAKYGREVIDRVRVDEANRLRGDRVARKALMTVHMLKDDLKALWDYRHCGYARRFWQDWYERAMGSGIEPLRQFARRLSPTCRVSWPTTAGPWAPIWSKASTTGSRRSSAWPMASAMTISRSVPPSPEFGD